MRRFVSFWVCAAAFALTSASAETVLICHTESVPAEWVDRYKHGVGSTVLEAVFDALFERGAIAFDAPFDEKGKDPAPAWLQATAKKYGAESVVYFQIFWKGNRDAMTIDKVSYAHVGQLGRVVAQGSFPFEFSWPNAKAENSSIQLALRLMKALKLGEGI